jgi:hypothetical protein
VRVVVWTPTNQTPEQEAQFRKLAELEAEPPELSREDRGRGFWTRVREAFTG